MLDNYINEFDKVDLIKADIQGHEYEFVVGAIEFKNFANLSLELPLRTDYEKIYAHKTIKLLEIINYAGRNFKKDVVFKIKILFLRTIKIMTKFNF